jgi:hypothetical protein
MDMSSSKKYIHTANTDRSYDSICLQCFGQWQLLVMNKL